MRHFLSSLAMAATIGFGVPAATQAQNPFEPAVYVNNAAVTRYEIDQRLRFMRLLGAPSTTPAEAEQALVDDRLRAFAATLLGIEATDEGVDSGVAEFAARAGLDTPQFLEALASGGVDEQTLRDFVRAGIVWRGVISRRILPLINITDAEVDQELRRRLETPIIDRVLLSELIIPAPPGQEQAALDIATRIASSRPSGQQFANAARQYSAVPSAEDGGRLDWVRLDQLPPSLRPLIEALPVGQTSQPLTVEGAVILFHKRDEAGNLRAGARDTVLDYMVLHMASTTEAARLAATVRYCDDLYVQVGPEAAAQVQRQTASPTAIPTLIATRLASMDPDEAAVVPSGSGADLVMLCDRRPALLADSRAAVPVTAEKDDGVSPPDPNALPDREIVQNQLFSQRANAAAEAYLAELRADAIIRRP